MVVFFFQAEDGIRDLTVTGVQTCALPIWVLFVRVRGARAARVARGGDAGGADRHAGRGGAGRRGDGAGGEGGGGGGGGAWGEPNREFRSPSPPPSRPPPHPPRPPPESQPLRLHRQGVAYQTHAVSAPP